MATTITKGEHTDEKTRAKIGKAYASKYKKGWSVRKIAEDAGRSFGFVHSVLISQGVELRGRGGTPGKKRVTKATAADPSE